MLYGGQVPIYAGGEVPPDTGRDMESRRRVERKQESHLTLFQDIKSFIELIKGLLIK